MKLSFFFTLYIFLIFATISIAIQIHCFNIHVNTRNEYVITSLLHELMDDSFEELDLNATKDEEIDAILHESILKFASTSKRIKNSKYFY